MRIKATFNEQDNTFKPEFKNLQYIKNQNRPVIVNGETIYDGDGTEPISLVAGNNVHIAVDNTGNIIISATGGSGGSAEIIGGKNIEVKQNELGQYEVSLSPSAAITADQIASVYAQNIITAPGDILILNGGNSIGD